MTKAETQVIDEKVPVIKTKFFYDWVKDNVPSQQGRIAVITGSNTGVGFWTAYALLTKGATVVLACRTPSKALAAKDELEKLIKKEGLPKPNVEFIQLDNSDFSSVRKFSEEFKSKYPKLDMLLNNAGVMAQKEYQTKDGFDIQIQTNHLSHFLLTSLLMDSLKKGAESGEASRVVQHSSSAHHYLKPAFSEKGTLSDGRFDGAFGIIRKLNLGYLKRWGRYGQSKLANVLFAKELDRKLQAAGLNEQIVSTSCHPGFASTNLQLIAAKDGAMPGWQRINKSYAQSAQDGALPIIMAATHPKVKGGDYLGPEKVMKGLPIVTKATGHGNNAKMADFLWGKSVEATGAQWEF